MSMNIVGGDSCNTPTLSPERKMNWNNRNVTRKNCTAHTSFFQWKIAPPYMDGMGMSSKKSPSISTNGTASNAS